MMENFLTLAASPAPAPTQQEIFQSIGRHMETSGDSGPWLVGIGGALLLVLLVALYVQKRRNSGLGSGGGKSEAAYAPMAVSLPVPPKNPRKLMKEVAAELGLSRQQMSRLKKEAKKRGLDNPLALLLCPSLIGQIETGKDDQRRT